MECYFITFVRYKKILGEKGVKKDEKCTAHWINTIME